MACSHYISGASKPVALDRRAACDRQAETRFSTRSIVSCSPAPPISGARLLDRAGAECCRSSWGSISPASASSPVTADVVPKDNGSSFRRASRLPGRQRGDRCGHQNYAYPALRAKRRRSMLAMTCRPALRDSSDSSSNSLALRAQILPPLKGLNIKIARTQR